MSANQNLDAGGGGDGGSGSDSTNTDRTTQTQRRALEQMQDPAPTRSESRVERRAAEQMQDPAPDPSTQQDGGSASPPADFDPGDIPSPDGSAVESGSDGATSSTRTDIGVGGVDTSPPGVIDRAIQGAREGGEQLVEGRIDRAQNAASTLVNNDALNAALLVGTTAAPGVPPANFALGARALGAAGGAAAGALGLGALSQSDIENPGLPDIGAGGTEPTTRSTVSTGEIPAPENPLGSVPSEIPAPTSPTGATQSEIPTPSNPELGAPGIAVPETPPSQATGEIAPPSNPTRDPSEIGVPGVASSPLLRERPEEQEADEADETNDQPEFFIGEEDPTIGEEETQPTIDEEETQPALPRGYEPFRFPADGGGETDADPGDVSRAEDPLSQTLERGAIAAAPTIPPDQGPSVEEVPPPGVQERQEQTPDIPTSIIEERQREEQTTGVGQTQPTPPETVPPGEVSPEQTTPPIDDNIAEQDTGIGDDPNIPFDYGYGFGEGGPGDDPIVPPGTSSSTSTPTNRRTRGGGLPGFGGGGGAPPAPVFGGGGALFESTIATPEEVLGTDDEDDDEQLTLFGGL